ncbi:SET domain protein, putative [Plasmodium gallinaceum]|uniref:[histone H3]-lysine(4) N-trimethyltransferase n=1 Tax=Plasmodium gallinaceum TaxID=5849 RepID=A0A1J1GN63_PLAGA|nr:SET domain protein, putative [Plasmodium gallinaceum]CRG93874.1 SET domain protein, putative [Plasmodium gallinaceum]
MNKLKEKKKIKKVRYDKSEFSQRKEKVHNTSQHVNTLEIKDGPKWRNKNEKKTQINIKNDLLDLKNNKNTCNTKSDSINKTYDKVEELTKNKKKILNDNNNYFSKIESKSLSNIDSPSCINNKSKIIDRRNCKGKSKKLKIGNNVYSKTGFSITDLKKKKIIELTDSKKLLNDKNLKENKLVKNKKIIKNTCKKYKPEELENKKSFKNNFSDVSINLEENLNNKMESNYLLSSLAKKKNKKNIFLKSLIRKKNIDSDVNNSKTNSLFYLHSLKNNNLNPLKNISYKFKSSKGSGSLFMYEKNTKAAYFTNSNDNKSYNFNYKNDINKDRNSYSDTNISYSPHQKKRKKKNIYNILFYDECFKDYQYNNEGNTQINNISKIYELFFNVYKKKKLINFEKNKIFLKKNIFFPYANYNLSLRSIQKRKYNLNFKRDKNFKIKKKNNKIIKKEEIKIQKNTLNNKNSNECLNIQNKNKYTLFPNDSIDEKELNKIKYNKTINIEEIKEKNMQNINNLKYNMENKDNESNHYTKNEETENVHKENNSNTNVEIFKEFEYKENKKINTNDTNMKKTLEEKNEEISEKVNQNVYEEVNDKENKNEYSNEKINININEGMEEKACNFIPKKTDEEINKNICEEISDKSNNEVIKKIFEKKNEKSDKEINEDKCTVINEKEYENTKRKSDKEGKENICDNINEEKNQNLNEKIKELNNESVNKDEIKKNEVEGTNKELKINSKNFIKYDETLFENFYNDIFLKKGKIVTHKRKKYFLTYKIIKDCYFRILILNNEKLEKNILQIIAIQDVVLSDKNVKIESDTLYVRNNDKLYAINFLKVFCLKYLKKLKTISEIIFSDSDIYTKGKEKHEISEVLNTFENTSGINIKKENNVEKNTNEISSSYNNINEINSFNKNSDEINSVNKNGGKINIISNNISEENLSKEYNDKYKENKLTENTLNNLNDNCCKREREIRKTTKTIEKEKNHKKIKENFKNNAIKEENMFSYKNTYDVNNKKKSLNIKIKKKKSSNSTSKKRKVSVTNENITDNFNLNIRKYKNRNNLKIKRRKGNSKVEECNYSGFIYNEKKKFYFNVHKIKDIINMIRGSEEKTRFYLDTNNSNIKKKLKLLKKVQNILFLENLNIDENEVLFKKPKFFNCIIEESLDNYNIIYQIQNGKYHVFENKLDEMKKKKKKKIENDSSNKYIELKDEEKGFKYIGYRVSFELKKDNKKKRHVKIGIIKYYSPKYKQFFIHHIENYRLNIQSDTPKSINKEINHLKNNDNSFLNTRKNTNSIDMKKYTDNYMYNLCDNADANENNKNNKIDENNKEEYSEKHMENKEELFISYENVIEEENDKKKNDLIFSDIKGWYSPYFYNIKILKTTKEFERFDILEKCDKKKEMNNNILKGNDECSVCKCKILFMKGYDHYTNNLSTYIYELSSEKEKKRMDEENIINVYWGVKCFICSKKFHANCLDDEVIITKSYDKNILMKEYKKYIYKNSLKKDKKCFNIEKEKSSKNINKIEEKMKIKGNSNEQKVYRKKKNINSSNNNNKNANKNDNSINYASNSNCHDSSFDPSQKNHEKNKQNNFSKDKNENVGNKDHEKNDAGICDTNCVQNDELNEIKSDCINENKNDFINDCKIVDEFSDIDANNSMKTKNKKYRKCINYIPLVKYNDVTYKKFICKDCYRCIYCCESIYNYKQTPNIANYVICKNCHLVAHGSCCFPNVPDIYLFNWKCDDCLKCNKCNYSNLCFINYNEWEFHLDCCINCYKEYEKKNFCIICNEKYEMNDSSKWVQCDVCKFWIHLNCDKNENRNIEILSIKNINYKCPTCSYGSFHDKIERILYLLFLLDKYKNFTFHVPINFYIYWRIVKIPMNLYIMKKKIWEKKYNTILDFLYDFILIIHNAKTVHMPNTSIYKNACNFEKKGKVIIKNMFNMSNEELNKYIAECLDKYKKVINEEANNNDIIKNDNDIKNSETTFTSDAHKLGSGNNSGKEDTFSKTNEYLIDRKNISTDDSIINTKKDNELRYNNESLNILEKKKINLTNNNSVERNDYILNNIDNNFIKSNNPHEENNSTHFFSNDHVINKTNSNNVNNTSEKINVEDINNIDYNSNLCDMKSGGIDNDCINKEKKLFLSYENNNINNDIKKEDIFYGIKISSNNKNILNDSIYKKRKLENIEKDITHCEIHELFNFKSNSFFIHRNKEIFESSDNYVTNYNIINISTTSKIYFNRKFDKYDDFDVCKILKVHILKHFNKNNIEINENKNEQGSILLKQEKDYKDKNFKENEYENNIIKIKSTEKDNIEQNEYKIKEERDEIKENQEVGINLTEKNISEINKDEKNFKKTDNIINESIDSNLFISNDIFMIDVLKEKVKSNNMKREQKKIVSPLNNIFNFLKCIQIIFFDKKTEYNKKKKVSTINKNHNNYENDEISFNHNNNTSKFIDDSFNNTIPLHNKKHNLIPTNILNSVNYYCFYDEIMKKKGKQIKLYKNDILKEYCHICGSIEYKNSFLFCSVCGISFHYSCVNIFHPFLFNLNDFDDHKKEINNILNVLTRNFKCSNCIKCDKCYNVFDETINDSLYFKIKNFNVFNNIFKNRTHIYLYNLKIEFLSLKKKINSKKKECLKDKKSDENVEKNIDKYQNDQDKSIYEAKLTSNDNLPNDLYSCKDQVEKKKESKNSQDEEKNCVSFFNKQQKKKQIENSNYCNDINDFNNSIKKDNSLDKIYNENKLKVQNNTTEKDLHRKKEKEKESVAHINQRKFVKILSVHDETSKIFKCFCCGKSSHNECFYAIDNNTNDILKSKVNISKRTLKNLTKKNKYVKKNNYKKTGKYKRSKSLNESIEKFHVMNNTYDNVEYDKVFNENIKTNNFKSNILDNSLSNCNTENSFTNDIFNNNDNIKTNKNNKSNGNEKNNDDFIDNLKLKCESTKLNNCIKKQQNFQFYNMNNNNDINTYNNVNMHVNNNIINNNDISTSIYTINDVNNDTSINDKPFNINNNINKIANKNNFHDNIINSDIYVNNNFNFTKDSNSNINNNINIDNNINHDNNNNINIDNNIINIDNNNNIIIINSNSNYNQTINKNLENALKDHDLIMEKLKEYRINKNNIYIDKFSNNLILNNEFIVDCFKVDPCDKLNNETIIINKKIFNKVILDKIYELIKKKKRIKLKNLLNLFKIDEFRGNFIIYEILNALNIYLNEKLSVYKLSKLEKNVKRENTRKIKNENISLFDTNLILNNRDEINITKKVLKIQSLITDILSNALNGKIINKKNKIKKYQRSNNNKSLDSNNNTNKNEDNKHNNYNSNSKNMLLKKNKQNLLELHNYPTHSNSNNINKDMPNEIAFCDTYNTSDFKNINSINNLNIMEKVNSKIVNSINNVKDINNLNSINNIDDMNNMKTHNSSLCSTVSYCNEIKKNSIQLNENVCEFPYNFNNFNESNFKIIDSSNKNIEESVNSKINYNSICYNKLNNLTDLNKSNNININMNNLNNLDGCNTEKNDIHNISTFSNNFNNINNLNILNNTNNVNNINNFNDENILNSNRNFNNRNNIGSVNNLYKTNNTNNMNNSEYMNNSNNINDMTIIENVKMLNSNNALIGVNNMEIQNKFINFNNMNNLKNINNESGFSDMNNLSNTNCVTNFCDSNNLKNIDNLYNFNNMTNSNEVNSIDNYNDIKTFNDLKNVNGTNNLNDMNNIKSIKHFNNINGFKDYIPHNSMNVNVNVNESNFQYSSYIPNKMEYITNNIYIDENINQSGSFNHDMDVYKNNYYFYNKMLLNNNPNSNDNLNINTTTTTDYNFLKNKNNNFVMNKNNISYNQIKNENSEMNENLINNNNHFIINDKDNFNNNGNLEYIKKDDNNSFQNIIFQNSSDMYQINRDNNFSRKYYLNKTDENHSLNNVNTLNDSYNVYKKDNNKNMKGYSNLLKSSTLNYDSTPYTDGNRNAFCTNNLYQTDELTNNINNDNNSTKYKTNESNINNVNERNIFFQNFDVVNSNTNNTINDSYNENNLKIKTDKIIVKKLQEGENKYKMTIEECDKVIHKNSEPYENNSNKENHLKLDNETKNEENNFSYVNSNKIENDEKIGNEYENNYNLKFSEKNINDEMLKGEKKIKKRKLFLDYKNVLIKKEKCFIDSNLKELDDNNLNNINDNVNKSVEKIKYERNVFSGDINKLTINNETKNGKKKKTKEEKEREKKMKEEIKKKKKKEKQKEKEKEKSRKKEMKNNKKKDKQKEKKKKRNSSIDQFHLKNNSSTELSGDDNLICKSMSNEEFSTYHNKEKKMNIHGNNISDELSSHSCFFESIENGCLIKDNYKIDIKNMRINKLTNFLKNNKFILKSKFKRITPNTYICLNCITLYKNDFSFNFFSDELAEFEKCLNKNDNEACIMDAKCKINIKNSSLIKKEIKKEGKRTYIKKKKNINNHNNIDNENGNNDINNENNNNKEIDNIIYNSIKNENNINKNEDSIINKIDNITNNSNKNENNINKNEDSVINKIDNFTNNSNKNENNINRNQDNIIKETHDVINNSSKNISNINEENENNKNKNENIVNKSENNINKETDNNINNSSKNISNINEENENNKNKNENIVNKNENNIIKETDNNINNSSKNISNINEENENNINNENSVNKENDNYKMNNSNDKFNKTINDNDENNNSNNSYYETNEKYKQKCSDYIKEIINSKNEREEKSTELRNINNLDNKENNNFTQGNVENDTIIYNKEKKIYKKNYSRVNIRKNKSKYFQINNEKGIKYDRECVYWINKISLYNNLYFNHNYLKKNIKKHTNINYFFKNKLNFYKCSICCMLFKWNTEKNDNIIEEENDNFNSLYICNLCSLRYDYILKLLAFDESCINFNNINKEENIEGKLYELLYFIIKMNYNHIYKKNVYKEMYNMLDEIFKENIKFPYILIFYNNFFKYEEFYLFFMNKIKKDVYFKKKFFKKDIYKSCSFSNFYTMKYMLDLFHKKIYKNNCTHNKTFTNLFNVYSIARKTLFLYLNKSNNYFEEIVNQSIYFLYLYYLYKLYRNARKYYTHLGLSREFITFNNDIKKGKKKKKYDNISIKIKNNDLFENIKRIFNEKESEDFTFDKCNEKRRIMCNNGNLKSDNNNNDKKKRNNMYKKENKVESNVDLCDKEILMRKKNSFSNSNNVIKKINNKDAFEKKVKDYVKKVKFTIKNKLTLYVKIMLYKYIEESLCFLKYENSVESKKKNSKICFLCSFGNYLYKGKLIPFYNLYLHSECLKWSLNCIQYYNFNSNNCEYNFIKENEDIKNKMLCGEEENVKLCENKKNKNKSLDNDSNYNKDAIKNFNYVGCNKDLNDENKTCKNIESVNQENLNCMSSTKCNSLKEKKNTEEGNFNNNIKSVKLMDNCEWTENKNFFNLYENMIEIEEDDIKEIIFDSVNSVCFLCGYKNASIYCSNENCNIKFHLNCAFYSTVVRNFSKNHFFHYLKCFNLIKFNNDTIFYNFNDSSSSNKENKEIFENRYKDIFPVHIIYKMKKIWCNKCWNLKKVYNTLYIEKKNTHSNNNEYYEKNKNNKYINDSDNCSSYNNNAKIKIENDIYTKNYLSYINTKNNDNENKDINEKKDNIKKLKNRNLILNKKSECAKTNISKLMNENETKQNYHMNKKELFKYLIHFYFEDDSYYVFDQILYSINQCIKIKYKNKSLNVLQENLNKNKKIELKMQEIEKFINKYININNDVNFISDRYHLLFKQNVMNKSHNDGIKDNLNYINIQNIINHKNIENILKCYFILKNFLFIGKNITLKNEEYFFQKKSENYFLRNIYDNDQVYNIYLPNVLNENKINSILIKKELNLKEKCDENTNRNLLNEENLFNKENVNESNNKSKFITFIDDIIEVDHMNYDNNTTERPLEKMKVNNSNQEKKEERIKNINLYFELSDKIKKIRITKFQDVCKYDEKSEKSKKYENFDEKNEEKKNNFISKYNNPNSEKNENILEINNKNDMKEKKEYFLNMIINKNNDVYIKKINDIYFSKYKKNTYNNVNKCKSKIIKIGCHNILSIGEILKYDGEKMIYPCGFLNMRIFFNLPSFFLFYIYKNVNINDLVIKKKILEEIFLQIRATYIFSITLKNNNFFFSVILFPLISIDYFSEEDAKKFILAEGYDINEVYMKFLSLFNCSCDKYTTDEYIKFTMKYKHIYKYLQNYIYKLVEYNKLIDVHDFFGLTLPCVIYQIKYKLFKFLWKNLSDKIKNYVKKKKEREESKKKIKNNTGEVIYNDNLLCKYSNFEASIFKENEKEKEKSMRKTVKYKYNINSAMSYRYLMNISSNSRLYVKKSNIHGYGLYTCEFINEGEPVIEYIGEYIRNIISDKREKYYDKIESSCYMFRLNENIIIDATKWGNVSRFINHSCEPNCFCKIVTCDQNLKHIVIFAKRDIVAHEEITYDYQFGIESEGKKLICLCGSSTCLGRMN